MCHQQHIHYQEHPAGLVCKAWLTPASAGYMQPRQKSPQSHFSAFGNLVLHLKIISSRSHLQIHPSAILFLIQAYSATNFSFGSANSEPLKMITCTWLLCQILLHSSDYANNKHFCHWVLLISMVLIFPLSRRKITTLLIWLLNKKLSHRDISHYSNTEKWAWTGPVFSSFENRWGSNTSEISKLTRSMPNSC